MNAHKCKDNKLFYVTRRRLADILQALVQALAPYPQMLVQFICWLLGERLMEQYNGADLLRFCFKTIPYEDSKVLADNIDSYC
jgi:pumilio RNA-binding family